MSNPYATVPEAAPSDLPDVPVIVMGRGLHETDDATSEIDSDVAMMELQKGYHDFSGHENPNLLPDDRATSMTGRLGAIAYVHQMLRDKVNTVTGRGDVSTRLGPSRVIRNWRSLCWRACCVTSCVVVLLVILGYFVFVEATAYTWNPEVIPWQDTPSVSGYVTTAELYFGSPARRVSLAPGTRSLTTFSVNYTVHINETHTLVKFKDGTWGSALLHHDFDFDTWVGGKPLALPDDQFSAEPVVFGPFGAIDPVPLSSYPPPISVDPPALPTQPLLFNVLFFSTIVTRIPSCENPPVFPDDTVIICDDLNTTSPVPCAQWSDDTRFICSGMPSDCGSLIAYIGTYLVSVLETCNSGNHCTSQLMYNLRSWFLSSCHHTTTCLSEENVVYACGTTEVCKGPTFLEKCNLVLDMCDLGYTYECMMPFATVGSYSSWAGAVKS